MENTDSGEKNKNFVIEFLKVLEEKSLNLFQELKEFL